MVRSLICVHGLALLVVACLLIAGCSTPDTTNQTSQPDTTTLPGAKYTAGDVVKNPSSTAGSAWLVIGYDAATDSYERALIYPNDDGSWGHRLDARTESAKRVVMEKVYTEVVENLPVSSVPVVTPTTVATEETVVVTTRATAVTTTTDTLAPKITRIIPDYGDAGTTVKFTDLVGNGFRTGINVTLSRNNTVIRAVNVKVANPKSINGEFPIPSTAAAGAWDLTVTNVDGTTDKYTNLFSVHRVAATTTTSSTHEGSLSMTYIDPQFGFSGQRLEITITGTGFKSGAGVLMQKSGRPDLVGDTVRVESDTQIKAFLQIPPGSFGDWDVRVTNADSSYGLWRSGFSIR